MDRSSPHFVVFLEWGEGEGAGVAWELSLSHFDWCVSFD
jgi:hypothetical protein